MLITCFLLLAAACKIVQSQTDAPDVPVSAMGSDNDNDSDDARWFAFGVALLLAALAVIAIVALFFSMALQQWRSPRAVMRRTVVRA